jgi:hypothetical protein
VTHNQYGQTTPSLRVAELAHSWARRAVLGIVRECGGQTVSRRILRDRPDLDVTVTDADPVSGLNAATKLKFAARRISIDYARQAREDGHSWQEIGVALGLGSEAEPDACVADAAYDYATGNPAMFERARSFGCVRPARARSLTADRGPVTRPTAKKVTPTPAGASARRSLPGTPPGTKMTPRERKPGPADIGPQCVAARETGF